MQQMDAVGIISKAMQANPDLLRLVESGAAALKVLAGEDDLTKALNILFNFGQYDNKMITEALGLLGNLALITENAQYFAGKGGVNALLDLVQFKCKQKDLSPEDLAIIANAIRALGRLLGDPKTATEFGKVNGIDQLKNLVERFGEEEIVMNAVMDALENLAKTKTGQKMILDSGILPAVTKVMASNPDYDVLFRKYAGLVGYMPLDNPDLVKTLVNAGLLKAITGTLLAKPDDRDAVIASSDMIRDLVTLHPHLAQQLAKENAQPLLSAIQAHSNDPEVLKHIFDAIKALANADPATLDQFKKIGLEDELNKILKQDNTSVEVQQLVQGLLDGLLHNDLGNLDELKNLSALDYQPDGVNIEEKEINDAQDRTEDMMAELAKLAGLLDDPEYASKYVQEGKVAGILEGIQNYYDNPKIVAAGLENLLRCALVNGAFLRLEEAGVPEAVVQCMLEHPDDIGVQLQGLKLLAALAQHNDPSVIDTLCQPLTLETALKAIQGNVKNPAMMGAFADLINGLLKDEKTGPQVAQALQAEGIPEFLQKGLEYHKMNMDVGPKISQAIKTIDQYLYNPNIGKMTGDVKPFGTMTMAQLANMDPEQLMKIMSEWGAEELIDTVKGAKNPKLVQSGANEINRRLNGGGA
ncbi:hypothetical protein RFI_32077 [Reticulomyxa filosa]|uniref:Uncharacterized protein n=1 Tax=Reticulomyxa filosa TaxID=46433 RepID=X6LX62_RETFI|nr:hypothetical protein RFI_32077 [Reticulomyxa filosa]|eukprot:ETO05320.1 hypothetical protein RFI_32077 [Reticulomyxa filosa]